MGWFDDQLRTGITQPPVADVGNPPNQPDRTTNRRGTYTSADIAALYKQLTGQDAPDAIAHNWGDDIDQNYYNTIRATISGWPEAVAYRKQQQNPQPDQNAPTTPDDWTSKDYSDPANVKAYAASRGIQMTDDLANYWAGKYNDPSFAGDRQYFFQRLSTDPVFGGGGGSGYSDMLAPFTEQFTYDDFKAPTMDDLKSSPGFQSSLDRASNTLQRSAAAKGSLLSGSTLQSLSDQTADLTSQGYSNLFNQDAQTYTTNRANAYGQYQDRRANFYQNQDSPFAKLMALSSLQEQDTASQRQIGLGYASLANQAASGGAVQYNNLLTGGANAQAAGIIGQNNAYQGLYGNLSQYPAWLMALMRGSGRAGSGSSFNQPNTGNS